MVSENDEIYNSVDVSIIYFVGDLVLKALEIDVLSVVVTEEVGNGVVVI